MEHNLDRRKLLKTAGITAGGVTLAAVLPATSASAATGPIADAKLVRNMIASFAQANAVLTASFFDTNAVWEEVPISLVLNGQQAIQDYLAQAYKETTYFYSQISDQLSFGGLVMHERVDNYNFVGSSNGISVRVMATAVCSSGLITRLSNYYDKAQAGLS